MWVASLNAGRGYGFWGLRFRVWGLGVWVVGLLRGYPF